MLLAAAMSMSINIVILVQSLYRIPVRFKSARHTFAGLRIIVIILYFTCFGCYVLFTRQPDYFDSEFATGLVVRHNGSLAVEFSDGAATHYAEVPYPFLHTQGKRTQVIYEASDPARAKQYGILGYWITFGELAASVIVVIALYYVAVSITSNPTPGALLEELEMVKKKPRKRKYKD